MDKVFERSERVDMPEDPPPGGRIVRTLLEGPRVRQSALMRGYSRSEGLGQLVTTLCHPTAHVFPHLWPPIQPVKLGQQRSDRSRHACERPDCVGGTERERVLGLRSLAALRGLHRCKGLSSLADNVSTIDRDTRG